MAKVNRRVVVIGTSAGGLHALDELFGQLPSGLPAPFLVVQHMAPQGNAEPLVARLSRYKSFAAGLAVSGQTLKPGRLYIAPADYHLLLKGNRILVTKGARENRYRPAIDALFRSAAVAHGPRAIGVILTGFLDDGTGGLDVIKRCGGVTVVQDPGTAVYSDMPRNALSNAKVDHCVALSEMGALLEKLILGPLPGQKRRKKRGQKRGVGRVKTAAIPAGIRVEAAIAERVVSDVAQVNGLGDQVPYNCPNCGGVLWKIDARTGLRYRCHTGHSFTALALLTSQAERVEETLWVALRMLEERKNLLNTLARSTQPHRPMAESYAKRAADTEIHIQRIRTMLLAREPRLTDT